MKPMFRPLAIVAFFTVALDTTDAVAYGPSNCILISKSRTGSCVISTKCQGVDTSKTEFGFSCVQEGRETQWQSYGNGGFEANEEFDSGMKCDECGGPSSDAVKFASDSVQMKHVEIPTVKKQKQIEYVVPELEAPEAPTTPTPPEKETATAVQESWEPSVWSPVPAAMQKPPIAFTQSFLRARSLKAQDTKTLVGNSNAKKDRIEAEATLSDDRSDAVDTSIEDSKSGSDDGYVVAEIETASPPQQSRQVKKLGLASRKALTEQLHLLNEGIKDLEKGMEHVHENVEKLNAKVFRRQSLAQTQIPLDTDEIQPTKKELNQQEEEARAEEEHKERLNLQEAQAKAQAQAEAVLAAKKRIECNEGNEFNSNDC